ncbi:MAG TPA: D-glycerate dehydrogenase [Candidatus Dormibacteraeota bacterium]|nr:D-glycerate dehydrogenase [Candidatus Dormibacteraeota bacterium]
MAKPKILSTHPLFDSTRQLLNDPFEMEYWSGPPRISRAELLARLADKEGLICLLSEKVDEDLLAHAPRLKLAATVSVGFDHIDVAACTRHGVLATNTPGVLDETTADFAWVLIFAVARRLLEAVEMTQSNAWDGWDLGQLCGSDVWGKTLGIVGFGRIGRAVARRAAGFGMKILYTDAQRAGAETEREWGVEYARLDRLLAESDFVTLHVPLVPATRHLISTAQLARMKPTAFLINTSRGPVVDEDALVRALDGQVIAGAGLDVYENEPKIHPGLLGRKNAVLTPHIASASVETRARMASIAAENALALFSGKLPPNALNPEILQNLRR